MTEQLARRLIAEGVANPRLYTIIKQCYTEHTEEDIANAIAYIRAEITLGVYAARTRLVPDPEPKRTTRTAKLVLDDK